MRYREEHPNGPAPDITIYPMFVVTARDASRSEEPESESSAPPPPPDDTMTSTLPEPGAEPLSAEPSSAESESLALPDDDY